MTNNSNAFTEHPETFMELSHTIYGFTTNELPEELTTKYHKPVKVGDTNNLYRRGKEWQKVFSDLIKIGHVNAIIRKVVPQEDGTEKIVYGKFRDHDVHKFLKNEEHYENIPLNLFNPDQSSQEFYAKPINETYDEIDQTLLNKAREVMVEDFNNNTGFYNIKDLETGERIRREFKRDKDFSPREYQQLRIDEIPQFLIENFVKNKTLLDIENMVAIEALLVSGTRTGKCFMSAKAIDKTISKLDELDENYEKKNQVVIVVTSIPAVLQEWEETYKTHKDFEGYQYYDRMDLDQLIGKGESLDNILEEKHVVVGLSMQDLAGRNAGGRLKEAHKLIKDVGVDFIIGDEAHRGMFSPRYGMVFDESELESDDIDLIAKDHETEAISNTMLANQESVVSNISGELEEISMNIKKEEEDIELTEFIESFGFKPRVGTLFVTATPFEIVSNTGRFTLGGEDVSTGNVFAVPSNQIELEAKKWDEENPDKPEWESPYFSIPIKYFYGVEINQDLEKGFFDVQKTKKKKFVNHQSIREIWMNIFGYTTKKNQLAPTFFSVENHSRTNLGNTIMVSSTFKRECDAHEKILQDLQKEGKLGEEYVIMNISSENENNPYTKMTAAEIREQIQRNEKSIILTVGRLTTGVTIPKLDVVILAKAGKSLENRLQTYGRVGSSWVGEVRDDAGVLIEKHNMKPNTVVIDFYPESMYEVLSSNKQLISHMAKVKKDLYGKDNDDEENNEKTPIPRLERVMTIRGDGTVSQMSEVEILDKFLETLEKKPITSLVKSQSFAIDNIIDNDLLLKKLIEEVEPLKTTGLMSSTVKKLEDVISTTILDGDNIEEPEIVNEEESEIAAGESGKEDNPEKTTEEKAEELLESRRTVLEGLIKTLTTKLIMLAILHNEKLIGTREVFSLLNLIKMIEKDPERFNANNLGIDVEMLKEIAPVFTLDFDMKLRNILQIIEEKGQAKAVEFLLADVKNISNNEIFTTDEVAEKLLASIKFNEVVSILSEAVDSGEEYIPLFLNLASKDANIEKIFYKKTLAAINNEVTSGQVSEDRKLALEKVLRKSIYSVPSSAFTYELVKKRFELMDWDINNVLFNQKLVDNANTGFLADNWAYGVTLSGLWIEEQSRLESKIQVMLDAGKKPNKKDSTNVYQEKLDKHFDIIMQDSLKKFVKEELMKEFDVVISNPPYQIDIKKNPSEHGIRNSVDVFPNFQYFASAIAKETILIYPATWKNHLEKENSLANFLINNGLKKVTTYEGANLFSTAIEKGYLVDIVEVDRNNKANFSINGIAQEYSGVLFSNNKQKMLYEKTLSATKLGLYPFYPVSLSNLKTFNKPFSNVKEEDKLIKIYIKRNPGKQADAGYFYVNEVDLMEHMDNKELINKYLVSIQTAPMGRQSIFNAKIHHKGTWNAKVFGPGEVFSNTYSGISVFDTLEEAENFRDYVNTKFFVILSSLHYKRKNFAKFVPDLADYTNNNPLFTPDNDLPAGHNYIGLSLNERLYELFELNEEGIRIVEELDDNEIELIEEFVKEMD